MNGCLGVDVNRGLALSVGDGEVFMPLLGSWVWEQTCELPNVGKGTCRPLEKGNDSGAKLLSSSFGGTTEQLNNLWENI